MHDDKHSKIWVPAVIILAILGLIWFAWWSISNSGKTSSELLKSKSTGTSQTTEQ